MQVELHSFFHLSCARSTLATPPLYLAFNLIISRAASQHRALTWEQDGQARVDRGDCGSVWRAQHTRDVRDIGKVNEFIQHRSSIDTRVSMLLHSERHEEWRAKSNPIQNPMMMMLKFIRLFFMLSLLLCAARSTFLPPRHFIAMLLARWSLLDASGGHKIDIKSLSHSEVIYTRNSNKRRKKTSWGFFSYCSSWMNWS